MNLRPLTEKQAIAAASEADELLYGGAAGGGKSELALQLARRAHRRALILRRTFPQLKRTLIPRALELFPRERRAYNKTDHVWNLPGGQCIQFGSAQYEEDVLDYLGTEYDLIVPDELTTYPSAIYLRLLRSLRTSTPGQRCRVVCPTNPGGLGHRWVVERWAPWLDPKHPRPAQYGELRWFVRLQPEDKDQEVDGPTPILHRGERLVPMSRTYIPARVEDNPFVNPQYVSALQALPEPFRSQQLYGDWRAGEVDDADQLIPSDWVRAAMDRWKPRESPGPATATGVDVARGGEDRMVAWTRHAYWYGRPTVVPGARVKTAQDALPHLQPHLVVGGAFCVDAIGVGAALVDVMRDRGLHCIPVQAAGGTEERDFSGTFGFNNMRALMYWRLREMLDPGRKLAEGEEPCELPPDDELFGELTSIHYEMVGKGIKVEKKDDIKERLGRSPDKADAVALAAIIDRAHFDAGAYIRGLRELNGEEDDA